LPEIKHFGPPNFWAGYATEQQQALWYSITENSTMELRMFLLDLDSLYVYQWCSNGGRQRCSKG